MIDPWFWGRPVAACLTQAQLLMECKAGKAEIFLLQTGRLGVLKGVSPFLYRNQIKLYPLDERECHMLCTVLPKHFYWTTTISLTQLFQSFTHLQDKTGVKWWKVNNNNLDSSYVNTFINQVGDIYIFFHLCDH